MRESKDSTVVFDGAEAFPDFANPKWIAKKKKEHGLEGVEATEMSARARKKKRIYKRKKADPKPTA
jgi:hypothetical protein